MQVTDIHENKLKLTSDEEWSNSHLVDKLKQHLGTVNYQDLKLKRIFLITEVTDSIPIFV